MPFPAKIQPVDNQQEFRGPLKPPVIKSRLKRLFDRPFNGVSKTSTATIEKPVGVIKEVEFEPSSICLDKMVQNFFEENGHEKAQKCGRNRCNCFNGNSNDSSDDEFDLGFTDSIETLKSLIPCATMVERNLLADASRIVEKNKTCKRKEDLRRILSDELLVLGFNASICKSKWGKSSSIPDGEYEYIDVIMQGERVLIDVDFRSEFEIARSTGSYKAILQSLPFIFVGKADRLQQIITIVSEAGRQSLKKKGMHVAPWRKTEYIQAKWLSPFYRTAGEEADAGVAADKEIETKESEWELIFGLAPEESGSNLMSRTSKIIDGEVAGASPARVGWELPVVRSKSCERGNRVVVTGLASLLKEKL